MIMMILTTVTLITMTAVTATLRGGTVPIQRRAKRGGGKRGCRSNKERKASRHSDRDVPGGAGEKGESRSRLGSTLGDVFSVSHGLP